MNVNSVSKIVAYLVFSGLGWLALNNVQSMTDSLAQIEKSINGLNQNLAVVMTTQDGYREKLIDHEKRLREQESKRR